MKKHRQLFGVLGIAVVALLYGYYTALFGYSAGWGLVAGTLIAGSAILGENWSRIP